MEKSKMTFFQVGVLIFFSVAIVGGIIALALSKSSDKVSSKNKINVSIWGSLEENIINTLISAAGYSNDSIDNKYIVSYKYIPPKEFNGQLLEALAGGYAPDIIVLTDTNVYYHTNRVNVLPYKYYSERMFKDSFIEGAEVFLSGGGIIAFPFYLDPLVMYWNRDIFNNASIAYPPRYWDEFIPLAERLSVKSGINIEKSAFALGGYSNVANAREILAAMMMQAGSPIVRDNFVDIKNVDSAVYFYTEFANPSKVTYTWNRSLPNSKEFFISDKLAVYFGFASEAADIRLKNPNLNFDISMFPQLREGKNRVTFGKFAGLAVLKQSKNISAAFDVVFNLVGRNSISSLSRYTGLPPVRRDLLSARPTDALGSVLFDSAFWSRTFVDPNYSSTNSLMAEMVDSIVSGKSNVRDAIDSFSSHFYNLLQQYGTQ
jgi:multiple sugar transport system substrate-binding protein